MPTDSGDAGAIAPVLIDDDVWAMLLQQLTAAGQQAATAWRAQLERDDGVAIAQLRRCAPEG